MAENYIKKGKAFKFGDNISTDHIAPGRLFHLRNDLVEFSKHVLEDADPEFASKVQKGDFVVAGSNFGLGSSREHAALVPNYLKIKAIFAISFARIHRSNLINNGILPLVIDAKDYDFFNDQDDYELSDLLTSVEEGKDIVVTNKNTNETITAHLSLSAREKVMIQYGGLLNAIKELGGDF